MTTNDDAFEGQTCGKGLAANSVLPAKLADLTRRLADLLEHHTTALDKSGSSGKEEYDAYASLITQYRDISERLVKAAEEMKSYRDLPMAEHDMAVMTAPRALELFEDMVARKQELRDMLEKGLAEDRAMLAQMRS
jgi:hypothetical protein